MSLISVIDILLVAIIIYELLALIKGTRAAYMLVGVAVLALALYFSSIGELTTLNWLLSALLPYTVFALIVIFSAEIRQALARLGRRLLLSRGSAREADVYDDIVLAANLFSQNQTGALMVIEREIGLRTYIESGVPLDARLSYDLSGHNFPSECAIARWGGDRAEGSNRRGGVLLPSFNEPGTFDSAWYSPPGWHRRDRGNRCNRSNCFRGKRSDQPGGWREDRAGYNSGTVARAAGRVAAPLCATFHAAYSDHE